MLAMNTEQQHARNTMIHLKLDKANTTSISDDKFFEDSQDLHCSPTQYVNHMRSFMTLSTTSTENIPEYHEQIYEFDEDEIDTKLKDFILSNTNR